MADGLSGLLADVGDHPVALQALLLGELDRLGGRAEADDDVDAGVAQVQRVRVALRRVAHGSPAEAATFENGGLAIDYAAGVVRSRGAELHLTPMEYRLLVLLARNVDKVLTHQYLLEHAWGKGQVGDLASLRVIMASLRKKIGADLVQTHVGVGYRMVRAE